MNTRGTKIFTGVLDEVLDRIERAAYIEGRDVAIDNAAMTAYDMGRPDIRDAINKLVVRGK
jgi:hypothetical protein